MTFGEAIDRETASSLRRIHAWTVRFVSVITKIFVSLFCVVILASIRPVFPAAATLLSFDLVLCKDCGVFVANSPSGDSTEGD